MSKIGRRPIIIPEGVTVDIVQDKISASFENNHNCLIVPRQIKVEINNGIIKIIQNDQSNLSKSYSGLYSRLITNMIIGVKEKFQKELTFSGTGYRIAVDNNEVILNMGYSHEVRLKIPDDLEVNVKKNNISISGIKKDSVGLLAAQIRQVRPPEVYKGKGIKYKEEIIKKKAGKRAATT